MSTKTRLAGSAARATIGRLPPSVIRRIGRAQFTGPVAGGLIRSLNGQLTSGPGTIRYGVGAGLKFDAIGGNPGYILGTTEPGVQDTLREYVRPGSVAYDIGANIGFISVLMASLVTATGRIFSFEPSRVSADRARANAALNGFHHVTIVDAAVGREAGELRLELGEATTLNRVSQTGTGPLVPVVSLDDWCRANDAPPPSFVKIDVEGSEVDVLEGMIELIRNHRPTMMIEIHWTDKPFHRFFAEHLEPLGYKLSAIDGTIPTQPGYWHALLVAG